MFDVGFWELCLIGVISLLVIGPERLPKVARLAGFWIGKTRTMVATVKAEEMEEFREEEIRQALNNQSGMDDFKQLVEEASESIHSIKSDAKKTRDELENSQQSSSK
jgi:sec-independent protein translocase protein TatB